MEQFLFMGSGKVGGIGKERHQDAGKGDQKEEGDVVKNVFQPQLFYSIHGKTTKLLSSFQIKYSINRGKSPSGGESFFWIFIIYNRFLPIASF